MIIKIATVLPSGKMSKVRTIDVEKQNYAPAVNVSDTKAGLQLRRIKGNYLKVNQLDFADAEWQDCGTVTNLNKMKVSQPDDAATLRGANNYGAIAEGFINVPEDGVYYLSSRMEQVWIDNKLVINNEGALKSWLGSLKESPSFIKTTLMDVKKATSILTQRIDEVSLEMKEQQSEDVAASVSEENKDAKDMTQSASSNDNEQTEVEEEKVARSAFRR